MPHFEGDGCDCHCNVIDCYHRQAYKNYKVIARGHWKPEKENYPDKNKLFLIDRRNEEMKRAWKKDQYSKVKGLFHSRY